MVCVNAANSFCGFLGAIWASPEVMLLKKKGRETETNLPSTCTDMSAVTHAVLRSRLLVTVDPGRMGDWGEMTKERSVLVRLGCCN